MNTKKIIVSLIFVITVLLLIATRAHAEMATVTAYSSLDSCNTSKCLMASGKSAYVGAVACPYKLPLGTKVQINGKVYTCNDRTAKRYNGRYDVFLGYGIEGHKAAIQWGKRTLDVSIVSIVK